MLPDQLVNSRRSLLAKAAQEQTLVMGFHFAFPGLGRVAERGDGWEWRLEN